MDVQSLYCKVMKTFQYVFPASLKGKQLDVLQMILVKRNVFAVLPTGYGKTLVYSVFLLLLDEVSLKAPPFSVLFLHVIAPIHYHLNSNPIKLIHVIN